jgi:DNA repair protein RecN
MLQSLLIQNYALISSLKIDFPSGFSAITGETGAGKSIIMGALSLILGQRADAKTLKEGENKCLIEGEFGIKGYDLLAFFDERDLEYDPEQCIIRREISASGKSRAFINDSPVGLNDLKDLGERLIDIHSQHQNLLLTENRFQLQVIDILAKNNDLRAAYKVSFDRYKALAKQLDELKQQAVSHSEEENYLRFQYKELTEANFHSGEQDELETEQDTLSHVEDIKSAIYQIEQTLENEEQGVVNTLREALKKAESLKAIYLPAEDMTSRLESCYLELKDLASDVNKQQEQLELDPERLAIVTERLDTLYTLQRKHKVQSIEDLLFIQKEIENKLQFVDNYEEQLKKLEEDRQSAYEDTLMQGEKLSESRKTAAKELNTSLVRKVSTLGMPNMQFDCQITPKEQPAVTGLDDVTFLFSANKGSVPKPVSLIASGGEISRLMLGLKSLIASFVTLPTIIFDEIDTGVSGEIADKMGQIMQEMGQFMQVIAITHHPQIASRGSSQYLVYKKEEEYGTETAIVRLSEEERVEQIARMLSGAELSPAAIDNAKELLKTNKLK